MSEHTHHHEHREPVSCGCGCGHCHEHTHGEKEGKKELILIGISAVLFIVGLFLQGRTEIAAVALFLVAYFILGGEILYSAVKNLCKGHLFDENFLMSVATIAAIGIGDFAEAVGVMLFFRVGEWFEETAVSKSRSQIMEAVDMRAETVLLMQGEETKVIPTEEAKAGDVILVRAGDRIPLDSVVLEGESRMDTAPVTGEPVPVHVREGDSVLSGCVSLSGVLKLRVEKVLEESMVSRILESVEHAAAGKPRIDRFITRFARIYTPIVVWIAVITAIIPSLITGDWSKWIYTAITFLVISCPCALVLSVPLAFFAGIGIGSKKGILFKGGLAVETLHHIKAIVMDKTGTITKGVFEVQSWVTSDDITEQELLLMAAECEARSAHPIAGSIVRKAKEMKLSLNPPKSVEEIAGKGIRAITEQGEILCGNRSLLEECQVDIPLQESEIAGTEVYVACNGRWAGFIVISDVIKEDSKEAILQLKKSGLQTVMLTGDSKQSADAVAKETGIGEVYAKLLPEEKLQKLQEIRETYGEVMFVGDGINDAPVLAGADVGGAMGSGADAAIEAADVVFMTSSMQALVEAFEIAKITNRISMQNIVLALGVKAVVMLMGFFGIANMWLAVFADTGVAMLCVLNAIRILRRK